MALPGAGSLAGAWTRLEPLDRLTHGLRYADYSCSRAPISFLSALTPRTAVRPGREGWRSPPDAGRHSELANNTVSPQVSMRAIPGRQPVVSLSGRVPFGFPRPGTSRRALSGLIGRLVWVRLRTGPIRAVGQYAAADLHKSVGRVQL